MIDNFKLIKTHLCFNSRDGFYFVQIIQRKKDGHQKLHSGNNKYRAIKSYYIYNIEQLSNLEYRIKELCNQNNARAYINMNVRNAKECALECIKRYSELILEDNCYQGNNIWDSICGRIKSRKHRALWVVDLDDISIVDKVEKAILSCNHSEDFTLYRIPTVHGCHIICNGFNLNQFRETIKEPIDIHKNSPTLLYYNDN